MASAPHDRVTGRVDAAGRLVAADPPLAALQAEAGSRVGARLVLPQVAAVARLARQLGVPVERAVIAAGADRDYDLWVRAILDGDEVLLTIDGWHERAPATPHLDLVFAPDDDAVAIDPASGEWATDAELHLTAIAPDLADRLGVVTSEAIGYPLTRFFKLAEDADGAMPILAALASRSAFAGQEAAPRMVDGPLLMLSARGLVDEGGKFAGFAGRAVPKVAPLAIVAPTGAGIEAGGDFNLDLDRALRTPLDRIIAAADQIVERSEGPLRTDYASYAADIANAGRHLLAIVQAMNESEADSANRVDLIAASSEAVSLVAAKGETKRIAVDLMATARIEATGDARQVVQIIVNILGNAIRHSPDDGVVTISIAEGDSRARLTIADQGLGIAPEDQAKIFDRFERLGSGVEDGVGLGLAIARRLARAMGGDVTLDSAPGKGARFTLDLPLAPLV